MKKQDYEEPRCPLDNSMWVKKTVTPIPAGRVVAKEDEYLSRNDYASALRHLLYWWEEADRGNDDRGKLLLCNELMGLYRKQGDGENAKKYADAAIAMTKALEMEQTISGATAFLNAGTVYKAFGEPQKSLEYFEICKAVYERELAPDSQRLAGLYNNMALTLTDLKKFSQARALYHAALDITKAAGKAEEAVTLLNLADCAAAEKGMEEAEREIQDYAEQAEAVLDSIPEGERDGNYAFVCEKCAPVFRYYGYFPAAKKFSERAAEIYGAGK